jgi:hypothetical protein
MSFCDVLGRLEKMEVSLEPYVLAASDSELIECVWRDVPKYISQPDHSQMLVATEIRKRVFNEDGSVRQEGLHLFEALKALISPRASHAGIIKVYAAWIYIGLEGVNAPYVLVSLLRDFQGRSPIRGKDGEHTISSAYRAYGGHAGAAQEITQMLNMRKVLSLFTDYRARQIRKCLREMDKSASAP